MGDEDNATVNIISTMPKNICPLFDFPYPDMYVKYHMRGAEPSNINIIKFQKNSLETLKNALLEVLVIQLQHF